MTSKEAFDLKTCRYFMPPNKYKTRITKQDESAFVELSSRGIQPQRITRGLQNLIWGKTYRDLQITQWSEDIEQGLITKYEIYSSLPKWLLLWAEKKLAKIPYDIEAYEISGYRCTPEGLKPSYRATGKGTMPMLLKGYRDMQHDIQA